jgi:hypothetical protein
MINLIFVRPIPLFLVMLYCQADDLKPEPWVWNSGMGLTNIKLIIIISREDYLCFISGRVPSIHTLQLLENILYNI